MDTTCIYLDHAATTPLDPEVLEAMLPYLSGPLSAGNPSSVHSIGRAARSAIDTARDQVARLIGADYAEIIFTSGGTESDNLALFGVMSAASAERRELITSSIEHHAVLHSAHQLEQDGYVTRLLPVTDGGLVTVESLQTAVGLQTALVSVMAANNELGTVQPIRELAQTAHDAGALFHTDAVQFCGIVPVDVRSLGCDLLSLCAHKLYGPKGVGALYIRQGIKVSPRQFGGAQEREKRPGTENVAGIVGFGAAAKLAWERREADSVRIAPLRDRLEARLLAGLPELQVNGEREHRLPGILNVSAPDVSGPTLLMNLDRAGVAVSSGSACSSGSIDPSHVLRALQLPENLAASGIRFSLGRATTEAEVDRAADLYLQVVHRLREHNLKAR